VDPLASADDVAQALGLDDAAALSEAQGNRVDGLLARVSREFRREAERVFTPGTSTVRLLTVAGRVHLAETVTDVDDIEEVTFRDCRGDEVTLGFELDGQDLIVDYNGSVLPSGVPVTVTYTSTADVPDEVKASVAAIVARHLTVDPNSAEAKSTELAAGPFRTRYAEWTSNHALLTEGECEEARSYRYPASSIIIQRP
jgi:hypothetical protein